MIIVSSMGSFPSIGIVIIKNHIIILLVQLHVYIYIYMYGPPAPTYLFPAFIVLQA